MNHENGYLIFQWNGYKKCDTCKNSFGDNVYYKEEKCGFCIAKKIEKILIKGREK